MSGLVPSRFYETVAYALDPAPNYSFFFYMCYLPKYAATSQGSTLNQLRCSQWANGIDKTLPGLTVLKNTVQFVQFQFGYGCLL